MMTERPVEKEMPDWLPSPLFSETKDAVKLDVRTRLQIQRSSSQVQSSYLFTQNSPSNISILFLRSDGGAQFRDMRRETGENGGTQFR